MVIERVSESSRKISFSKLILREDRFTMVIERVSESSRKISFEKSATQFALRLGAGTPEVVREAEAFVSNIPFTAETPSMEGVNFKKYEKNQADISNSLTLEDVSKKANLQKDWNCPWVSKDGSRLKQAIRYVEEPVASAKTSSQHYYSHPGSILAPEPTISKEELEALIREHGQESRPQSRAQEQVLVSSKAEMSRELRQESSHEYYHEREEDSQAPPELEPINLGYEQFQQPAMGGYGQDHGYEPSADELIEVLKNLENLAAADPQLYRTIVDQIKGGAMGGFFQQAATGNGQASQYEQQMYEQQQKQQMQMQMEQQRLYEEQERMMQQQEECSMQQTSNSSMRHEQTSSSSMRHEQTSSSSMRQEQSSSSSMKSSMQQQQQQQEVVTTKKVHQVTETAKSLGMSEEEFKQHSRMKRLEAEAQEEVRQTLAAQREAKMKKLHPPAPPPPKEITVIAGDGKAVKIHLGGEPEQEDSRRQVAEAAGLKHVPLPDFDTSDNSAWAGSLKKVTKSKQQTQEVEDGNPWAGSLRHVEDIRRGKAKRDDSDETTYGNAPWMGTLRHVVHDNKVTKNYGVNQFQSKRYPDEDATNPFEGSQGSNARPQFPLTPAAIINGAVMSRDDMARREEEEEVERIRSNIGSKTVSTALLQALMPKLLKMHEAKYEPMDKVDAEKIMEEILGMKAGLNPDQQADANEEAEMIIRAIMQEEIDKSIYSKMADDLETAKKRMHKKKTKKVSSPRVGVTA